MRSIFTLLFAILILGSCKHHPGQQPAPDTPKALQPSTSSGFSKRYESNDLVSDLYAELADKDTALKALEKQISDLEGRDAEALADFNSFDARNKHYYGSATPHLRAVQDSAIRKRMTDLIHASETQYDSRVLAFNNLITRIGSNKTSLNDLHELLKIIKTLPVMDKYQRENEPSSKPAEAFLQELEKLVQKMNGMTGNK